MKTIIAPPTQQHAGWYDDDLELDFLYGFQDPKFLENEQFNTLYGDNRGRYFLAFTKGCSDPMDMPWTAFHMVDFFEAANWSLRAYKCFLESDWGTEGSHAELLEAALKLLSGRR